MKKKTPDRTVDLRGLASAQTLIQTRDALRLTEPGQTLCLVTDDESSARTAIPDLCERKGYPFRVEEDGNRWTLTIQRAENPVLTS